ncbi:MAG: DUF998 domain-containing protein [Candidatus Thorarchaeota archaeon]
MAIQEKVLRLIDEKHFPLWGILGSVIGYVFILVPMIPYTGRLSEPFSIFTHYVSQLGELEVSEFAWMFNLGMILAGITFIPFMIGLGRYLENNIAKIAAIGGAYSSVSIVLVGIYPMDFSTEHVLAAMSFFFSGMIMVVLWAISILMQRTAKIPKAFSVGGLVNAAIFAGFLFGPDYEIPGFSLRITLEWGIYFAIVSYLLVMAVYVWRKERIHQSNEI